MTAAFASAGAGGAIAATRPARDPLLDTIEALEGRLSRLPHPRSPDAMRLHHRMADELTVDVWRIYRGRVSVRPDGARVTLHGITASGTEGITGALRNWIAAARRKMGETE